MKIHEGEHNSNNSVVCNPSYLHSYSIVIRLYTRENIVITAREPPLEKIVIIGSSGAGKTTFAKILGSILGMQVFHLDRLFWQNCWQRKNGDKRKETLETLVFKETCWIIDGNYLGPSPLHLEASDTIIFLDLPPLQCLWRLVKRHTLHIPRDDIPEGCVDRLTLLRVLKVSLFPLLGRKTIKQTLRTYADKKCIRLRSTKEVNEFLEKQKSFL